MGAVNRDTCIRKTDLTFKHIAPCMRAHARVCLSSGQSKKERIKRYITLYKHIENKRYEDYKDCENLNKKG